jgi:two-component system, cell cycle sensor histidine kinase and response regulator CckA
LQPPEALHLHGLIAVYRSVIVWLLAKNGLPIQIAGQVTRVVERVTGRLAKIRIAVTVSRAGFCNCPIIAVASVTADERGEKWHTYFMPVFGLQPPGLLQTILEDIGVALLVVDRDERVVFANRTALQLFDATKAAEGARFRDLRSKFRFEDSSGNEIPLAESMVIRALKNEPVDSQDIRLKKPSGETRWLMEGVYRFCSMGLEGVVVLLSDETAEVEVRRAAAQLQRMETLGSLAAGLTHDFNNVLNTITTNVALAREDGGYSPQVGARFDQISDAVNNAAGLIRRLMQFSRSQDLHLGSVDVNDVVRDVLRLIQPLLRDNLRLTLNLASDLPAVYGDFSQIEQVLVNLIVNALDAMPDGGGLTIGTHVALQKQGNAVAEASNPRKPGELIQISIADTGIGIPIEIQSAIFEPFFTTKPEGKGTGLGLSSAFGIIRQHGGKIEVRSSPGKGATFTVSLPAQAQSQATVQ